MVKIDTDTAPKKKKAKPDKKVTATDKKEKKKPRKVKLTATASASSGGVTVNIKNVTGGGKGKGKGPPVPKPPAPGNSFSSAYPRQPPPPVQGIGLPPPGPNISPTLLTTMPMSEPRPPPPPPSSRRVATQYRPTEESPMVPRGNIFGDEPGDRLNALLRNEITEVSPSDTANRLLRGVRAPPPTQAETEEDIADNFGLLPEYIPPMSGEKAPTNQGLNPFFSPNQRVELDDLLAQPFEDEVPATEGAVRNNIVEESPSVKENNLIKLLELGKDHLKKKLEILAEKPSRVNDKAYKTSDFAELYATYFNKVPSRPSNNKRGAIKMKKIDMVREILDAMDKEGLA